MSSKIFGYARVSTSDQNTNLQRDKLLEAGCDQIFEDIASGAKANRPELDRMLEMLREGDTVVVWKLDRLGRSMQHLIDLIDKFNDMGVQFKSLTEQIDTSTAGGTLIFNVFASIAQFERDLIRERTKAGLEAARARGRNGGRRPILTDAQIKEARELYMTQSITVSQIARMMGCGRSNIYRALRNDRANEDGGR